jgi:hypothetical protein
VPLTQNGNAGGGCRFVHARLDRFSSYGLGSCPPHPILPEVDAAPRFRYGIGAPLQVGLSCSQNSTRQKWRADLRRDRGTCAQSAGGTTLRLPYAWCQIAGSNYRLLKRLAAASEDQRTQAPGGFAARAVRAFHAKWGSLQVEIAACKFIVPFAESWSPQRNGISQGRQEAVAKPVASYGEPLPLARNPTLNCTPGP